MSKIQINFDNIRNSITGNIDWKNSINKIIKFKHNNIEEFFKIINYNKMTRNITIIYNNNEFIISSRALRNGELSNVLYNKQTKEFKIKIGQKFKDNKRDIIILDRKRNPRYNKDGSFKCYDKMYKYKCNKCGFDGEKHWDIKNKCYKDEFWIVESNLLKGVGCSCCCDSPQIIVKGINDVATTNPELVKYFVNIEDVYIHTKSSTNKVLLNCLDCDYKKEMNISKLYNRGFSCPRCGDGIKFPNKFMFNLLQQLNIEFKTEYSPKWIKPRRYDFYIPEKQLIIEMDGGWHTQDNNMSGQTAEQSKQIDNYKDKLAFEHGLEVVRIDCDYSNKNRFEYIKNNIINSILSEMFDLSNVDWINIKQHSEKNLVKEACDYWNLHNNINNENLTIIDVCEKFNRSFNTITKWLKKGERYGWCHYKEVKL